jgi:hypothetical protein
VKQAQRAAYAALAEIQFGGMQYRGDIGIEPSRRVRTRWTAPTLTVFAAPRGTLSAPQLRSAAVRALRWMSPAPALLPGSAGRIVAALEAMDGQPFRRDEWTRPEGGGGIARVIEEGTLFERAASTSRMSLATGCRRPRRRRVPGSPIAHGRPWAYRSYSIRAIRMCRRCTSMCGCSSRMRGRRKGATTSGGSAAAWT